MALGAQPRIAASHVCRWVSTNPGITMQSVASITSASALMFGSTETILSSSTSTSPVRSPIWGSMLTTVPPRISVLVVICPCSFASGVVSLVPSESGESSYGVDDLLDGRNHLVL